MQCGYAMTDDEHDAIRSELLRIKETKDNKNMLRKLLLQARR